MSVNDNQVHFNDSIKISSYLGLRPELSVPAGSRGRIKKAQALIIPTDARRANDELASCVNSESTLPSRVGTARS